MKRQLCKLTVMRVTGFIFLLFFCVSFTARSQDSNTLKLKGDLRFRQDFLDEESKELRYRQVSRARVSLTAQATDDVNVIVQLAGGSGDSPISRNQYLGNGYSAKQVWIDMAYFDWHSPQIQGLNVVGGKVNNPFYSVGKSQLVWDSDNRPEGLAAKYSLSRNSIEIFTGAYYFIVDERATVEDSFLLGGQGGFKYSASSFYVTAFTGYYTFTETKGNPTYHFEKSRGNSIGADSTYANDFNEIDTFGEIGTDSFGFPVALHAEIVINTAPDTDNQGYLVGFTANPSSWSFLYDYRHLEKDAVVGAFTESDFIGGGTDAKGHKFVLGYTLANHVNLAATYYLNTKKIENGTEYHRVQLDIITAF